MSCWPSFRLLCCCSNKRSQKTALTNKAWRSCSAKCVTWLGQPCAPAPLPVLPAQLSTSGTVVTQKLWAASVALAGLSGMALWRSPAAVLPCAGSHGQAAFVPLCHPDYKCGHQG